MKEPLKYHPEGDALYHSLQVFDLARDELAYDEEFLAAALLHDVGKAIDPADHVAAGLEALDGFITERTAWLIEHHMLAHATGRRHARRPRPPPAGRIRALRRSGAARRVRPRRPRNRASKRRSSTKRSITCARLGRCLDSTRFLVTLERGIIDPKESMLCHPSV